MHINIYSEANERTHAVNAEIAMSMHLKTQMYRFDIKPLKHPLILI